MTQSLRHVLCVVASLVAPCVSQGGALVTLASPTQLDWSQSMDLPFDQTYTSTNPDPVLGHYSTVHLTLNATSEAIVSTLDAHRHGNGGSWQASFSLDIAVDLMTPFVLEVQAFAAESAFYGYSYSSSKYRFHTTTSDDVDVSFVATSSPSGGRVTGFLLPGETYRLEFESEGGGGIYRSGGVSGAGIQSSAVLVMPEPASAALLLMGSASLALVRSTARRRICGR